VTVRVDSLNLGRGDVVGCQMRSFGCGDHSTLLCYESWHSWAYDPVRKDYFRSEAQLPSRLLSPGERWTERERERICRVCLRHEWIASKWVPKPKVKSEFEKLRERLVAEHFDGSQTFSDTPDSVLWPAP